MGKIFSVTVIPNAKVESVHVSGELIKVKTHQAPEKDKANKDVIQKISNHFNVSTKNIQIIRGHTSRKKIIKITQ